VTGFHYTGRVDGRAFPLAELTGRQHGPSTRLVETGLNCQVKQRSFEPRFEIKDLKTVRERLWRTVLGREFQMAGAA